MQTLTPALTAILKSKLQAGPYGFSGRCEVDGVPSTQTDVVIEEVKHNTTIGGSLPFTWDVAPVDGQLMVAIMGTRDVADTARIPYSIDIHDHAIAGTEWDYLGSEAYNPLVGESVEFASRIANGDDTVDVTWPFIAGSSCPVGIAMKFASGPDTVEGPYADSGVNDTTMGVTGIVLTEPGVLLFYFQEHGFDQVPHIMTPPSGDGITLVLDGYERFSFGTSEYITAGYQVIDGAGTYDLVWEASNTYPDWQWSAVALFIPSGTTPVVTLHLEPKRIALDKSISMAADEAEIEFENEQLLLGWGTTSVVKTNSRVRVYQSYGGEVNEERTFTGIVDSVVDHRDVLTTTLTCRSMKAILIDQTFTTHAPQTKEEYDRAVDDFNHGHAAPTPLDRTPANGVYLNMEASDIVSDILDRAGWPVADRDITPTSYVLDEYILGDGWTWAESIEGDDRLTTYTGYILWDDELGVIHFGPPPATNLTDPQTASYVFRVGEDITSLDDSTDQDDLITRVKVRGPLTTTSLKDTWTEVWRTSKLHKPVGIWYSPSEPTIIRVIDRGTKRMYRLRQSDRAILGSVDISGIASHPLGLSGDPSDATIYWLLQAPWIDGGSGGNKIVKVRKSDNHALARYAIPDGRWSALKVSTGAIWLTNLDTDKLYKRSKTDGSAINSWHHTYNGVTQANPSGVMVDGTDLFIFYSNGGTTARFLKLSTSAPGTVIDIIKTAGTALHGGEMDTTTHIDCYGDSDSLGLVGKFTLKEAVDHTSEVFAEVVDTDLEDELGALAQSEPRQHDTHPGDADHAFEIRRLTVDLSAITNLAQATQTAQRLLDEQGHRKRVVDVGILGNPAIQKVDLIAQIDGLVGISESALIDTYRSEMVANETYLGTLAVIPTQVFTDTPADDGTAVDDGAIDDDPTPDDSDPGTVGSGSGSTLHFAASGNDTTGDGSIGNPYASLAKALAICSAGDLLVFHDTGGTFSGSANRNQTVSVTGTADNPITLVAAPGEEPTFDGGANGTSDEDRYFFEANGPFSHYVIDGLKLINYNMNQNGIITLTSPGSDYLEDWAIRHCDIQQKGPQTTDPNTSQIVYCGSNVDGVLFENNIVRGPYPAHAATTGAGFGTDHGSDTGIQSAKNLVVRHNVFIDCHKGVQIYGEDGSSLGVTIEAYHNTFIGCGRNVELVHYMTASVYDNAGETASESPSYNLYDSHSGTLTATHNYWAQTFDGDYKLEPGNSGVGAASDGTDAGAIDS